MPRIAEGLSLFHGFLRTLLGLVTVGLISVASWFGYSIYYEKELILQQKDEQLEQVQSKLDSAQASIEKQSEQIQTLETDLAESRIKVERLNTALTLLKVDHRLARLRVVSQQEDEATGDLFTKIEFVELNDQGDQLDDPREFRIRGDIVYVDYWIVKFEDKYVEQADIDRSTSICLFRRIFGEFQEPKDGYVLDQVGSRPSVYARGSKPTPFEKKIWDDFWNLANAPEKAKELGIRAVHGQAVSTKLREGKSYRLLIRSSGGLSITPEMESDKRAPGDASS